jgi:hypothetical protein
VSLPGAYSPASIALRVTGAGKPPLHDKAVVLEEEIIIYRPYIIMICVCKLFIFMVYLTALSNVEYYAGIFQEELRKPQKALGYSASGQRISLSLSFSLSIYISMELSSS